MTNQYNFSTDEIDLMKRIACKLNQHEYGLRTQSFLSSKTFFHYCIFPDTAGLDLLQQT